MVHEAGFGEHKRRIVDALDERAGPAGGQVDGAFARSAAQIDHVRRGVHIDPGEQLVERASAFRGVGAVLLGAPHIS